MTIAKVDQQRRIRLPEAKPGQEIFVDPHPDGSWTLIPAERLKSHGKFPRLTNVEPAPKKVLDRLYAEREEDAESIPQFIAAQPKDAE